MKLRHKISTVYIWLISYLLVLAVPVIITLVTYNLTVNIVETEVNNSNEFFLQGFQKQIDGVFSNAEQLARELSLNTSVLEVLRIQNNNGTVRPFQVYQIVNELKAFGITDPSIETFYICFGDLDLIFTPETSNTAGTFYVVYIKETGLDYRQWESMVSGNHHKSYVTPLGFPPGDTANNIVFYIQTIPVLIKSQSYANIIVKVDSSKFSEYEQKIHSAYNGSLLILSSNNEIIMASGNLPSLERVNYDTLQPGGGVKHITIDGINYMLSHIDSELGEFKYISFIPEKIFWEKAAYVKRTAVIGLLLCIVLGGIITGISIKKNYNPLKQLVKFLENNNEGPRYDKKSDEYSFIRNTIVQVKQAKEKTDTILNQQKNELKVEFLNRLLQGTTGRKLPTDEILSFYGIHFQGEFFVVLVFYLEDFDEAFWIEEADEDDDSEKETYRLLQYTISNVIENLLGEDSRNHIIGMNDTLVLLLNFSDITSVSKEALNNISFQAVKNLKEQYNIDLSVSISSPHTSIEGIPAAYNEALQVMEYKRLLNAGQILHYDDIADMPRGDYYYPLDQEYKLINHIKAGDYENSKKILDDVFRENFESNTPTPVISRCLMFNLVSTMIKTIDEINKAENKEFIESQTTINKLLNCENIGTMKEELERTLRNFCDYIKKNSFKKSEDMEFIESVKSLISLNYQDYNLSVNYIADELNVHPVHLSKVYKQMTGEGLHDYINRYRTEKAKDLIKQRKYHNLEGVANAVGFTNTRTFTRAFKRAEGITPGKFKEI